MLTNELDLPFGVEEAVRQDPYSKGDADYSVTELIGPARLGALRRRYGDQVTEDVSDRVWSLIGQIGHKILERADLRAVPSRVFITRTLDGVEYTVSGQGDSLLLAEDGNRLDDYKFTSVGAALSAIDGGKSEFEAQLNLYRLMLHEAYGWEIGKLRDVLLLRDWRLRQGRASQKVNGRYPHKQAVVVPMPVWTMEQAEAFLLERLAAHVKADALSDAELPECAPAERWMKPTKYAVLKGKRAMKGMTALTTRSEADFVVEQNPGTTVQVRGGGPTRCLDYCLVGRSGLCSQWNKELEADPTLVESETYVDLSALD